MKGSDKLFIAIYTVISVFVFLGYRWCFYNLNGFVWILIVTGMIVWTYIFWELLAQHDGIHSIFWGAVGSPLILLMVVVFAIANGIKALIEWADKNLDI